MEYSFLLFFDTNFHADQFLKKKKHFFAFVRRAYNFAVFFFPFSSPFLQLSLNMVGVPNFENLSVWQIGKVILAFSKIWI